MLKVNFTAVTPFMQTETTETRRKEGEEKAITTIKTRTIYDEETGGLVKLPIYTGNGFRGLLRRKMSEILLEEAQRKEIKINTTDYFLMTAGGGANYQKQEFDIVQKVKSLNPLISLLGTSLAIPGKLIVTDFMPVDYRPYLYEFKSKNAEANGEEFQNNVPMLHYGCSLIQTRTFTKKDDILNQTKFGRFLSKEDVKAWEETIEKERAERKNEKENNENKKSEDKKERKTIQSILNAEYIIPGTKFAGYITVKDDLTDIEYGLLLKGLANLTYEYLGAGSSNGFGIANYNIYDAVTGEEVISSLVDSENLLFRKLSITEREYELNCIAAVGKWLNDITEDNIDIAKLMKSSSEKKAQKTEKAKAKKDEEESEE